MPISMNCNAKSHNNWSKALNLILILSISCVIFSSQFSWRILADPGYSSYLALVCIGCFSTLLLLFKTRKHENLKFNLIDFSFLLFSLIIIVRWILTPYHFMYSNGTVVIAILPIYTYLRTQRSFVLIHWAILSTGIFQAVLALAQGMGCIENVNDEFKFGGTLGNPNVFSMVIMFTVYSAITLLKQEKIYFAKFSIIAYIALAVSLIFITGCRTVILTIIISIIFTFLFLCRAKPQYAFAKKALIIIMLISCVIFSWLIHTKSDSMLGRVLIWKASLSKISEQPIWGYGIGSFHKVYPDGQLQILECNNSSQFQQVAGTPNWAYNDFLEFWIEGGVFVGIAFIVILLSVFFIYFSENKLIQDEIFFAFLSINSFFVFGFVNFAFAAWPVLLLFVINLSLLSCSVGKGVFVKIKKPFKIYLILGLSLLFPSAKSAIGVLKTIRVQYRLASPKSYSPTIKDAFYNCNKDYYWNYPQFAFNYSVFLKSQGNDSASIDVLEEVNQFLNSYDTNVQLAEAYMYSNDFPKAIFYFEAASAIVPNRITPYYQRCISEFTLGNYTKADSLRKIIIERQFKGDPAYIRQIKNNITKWQ